MKITEYTVEKIQDPTGIIEGDRYEFFLTIEVPEEDELFEEKGLQIKVLYKPDEKKILNYHFYNSSENKYLDFELEDDEEQLVLEFCQEHYTDVE